MAEIRINATGGVKLYDADDSHYAQIVAGTITSNVNAITLGHDVVSIVDNLALTSDSAVLKFGADNDTTLTHTDGTGLTLNSTNKLCFNDASQFVQGSSATVLSIGATDEIDLTATAIDINGTADVSGAFTTGSTIVSTGAITSNAGVVVDNITIDGTEIDLSSGDLTLDVAGDIVLDADGGDIKFKDAGTHIGSLINVSSDFVIQVIPQDKDIVFKGDDGGSVVTALTLDISDAGKATFNNDVVAFSDERLKSDIKTIENGLDKVLKMRGVTFKRDGVAGTGVIAQEIQDIFPEVVSSSQEYLAVAYGNMVGVLIEAIKDLQGQLDKIREG